MTLDRRGEVLYCPVTHPRLIRKLASPPVEVESAQLVWRSQAQTPPNSVLELRQERGTNGELIWMTRYQRDGQDVPVPYLPRAEQVKVRVAHQGMTNLSTDELNILNGLNPAAFLREFGYRIAYGEVYLHDPEMAPPLSDYDLNPQTEPGMEMVVVMGDHFPTDDLDNLLLFEGKPVRQVNGAYFYAQPRRTLAYQIARDWFNTLAAGYNNKARNPRRNGAIRV